MATMKIMFDSQHNPIPPTILLANRNGNRLGVLTNVYDIYVSDTLSDTPELTFKVKKQDQDKICHLWNELVDLKLIYCIEWNTWFEIRQELTDGQQTIKAITATALCQSELSQILIFGTEINTEDDIARDDYKIPTVVYDEGHPEASLLNRITVKAVHYRIKHVDASLRNIQRTFSFDNISIKDAIDEICKEINCLVIYGNEMDAETNCPARTISLYDLNKNCLDCEYRGDFSDICPKCGSTNIRNEYGTDTTIFISKDNLTDEVVYTTDIDSVKNCFKLEAGDDLMTAAIISCNPNGTSYIWYISDEVKSDMPIELTDKIESYDSLYRYYKESYEFDIGKSLLDKYNALITKYKVYNKDLKEIDNPIIGYSSLMDAVYETIDFELYLKDVLMPTIEMSDTTAEKQAALLTSSSLSPVSVSNIDAVSHATTDNYVLAAAKIIIDSRYRVKIKDSDFDKTSSLWSGTFTVTNYSDDEDTATSNNVIVSINGNYEIYIKQKIEKVLNDGDTEDYSISGLMKKDLVASNGTFSGAFAEEIRKYGLSTLKSFHDCCQGCIDILIEHGIGDRDTWSSQTPNLYEQFYANYYNRLQALEAEIKIREAEINIVTEFADVLDTEIEKVHETLDFEKYLGKELWEIFCSYRRDDLYSNNNYISDGLSNSDLFKNAREFISTAEKELYKSATLQHRITSTLKNLLVLKEFQKLVEYFAVGNWIRIEIDGNIYRLRLIGYDIDFNDLSNAYVEFSDVTKVHDGISDSESILEKASSMATSYGSVERQSSKGRDSYDKLMHWFDDGMDATFTKFMNSADSQDMVFDKHGLLLRKHNYMSEGYYPTQLKILNSTIAITDDDWKSIRTAIGNFTYKNPETGEFTDAFGINGEVICGRILLGENLGIYNSSGKLSFNKDGLIVTNGTNTFTVNPNNADKLLCISNKDSDLLYVDDKGMLHIQGDGAGLDIENNSSVTSLSTRLTVNENGLLAEINRAEGVEGALSTRIEATEEGLQTEISRANKVEGALSTRISQTADQISAEVTRAKGAEENLSSNLSQTAEQITLEVARAKKEEENLSSRITQTASDITLQVTAGKNEAISTSKEYTDSQIKISTDKITSTVSGYDDRISTLEQTSDGFTASINSAKQDAAEALSIASDAEKVATNYLDFSSSGLVVGDMTKTSLGQNVLIGSDRVDIRNNTSVLASYRSNSIYLGLNNRNSIIDLCNGIGKIYNDTADEYSSSYDRLILESPDAVTIAGGKRIYQYVATGSSKSTFAMSSHAPWVNDSNEVGYLDCAEIALKAEEYNKESSIYLSQGAATMRGGSGYNNYASVITDGNSSSVYLEAHNDIYFSTGYGTEGTTFRPYYKFGDRISLSWYGAGFITSSSKSVCFSIPLPKPIVHANIASVSSVSGLMIRQDGKYLYGSSSTSFATPSSYSATIEEDAAHIRIQANMSDTTNVVNNSACGIYASISIYLS